MCLATDRLSTPIGTLLLVSDESGRVRALDFEDYEARMLRLLKIHGGPTPAPGPAPAAVRRALDPYFAGDLGAIDDVAVAPGGTPFQGKVWAALRRIPAGTTTSYGALAAIINRPSAMRAVGLAVGSNPVAMVVPCHRVTGADHSLTGYGGGLQLPKSNSPGLHSVHRGTPSSWFKPKQHLPINGPDAPTLVRYPD